jgi:two-component system, sensor histidine kinase and response regulator
VTWVAEALEARDARRLCEAAHKLRGLLSAFSVVAGGLASDLEGLAAGGRVDEARPLVERLETMARELSRQVDALSLETLSKLAAQAELKG